MTVGVDLENLRHCAASALLCASKWLSSRLTIRKRVWSGRRVGEGTATIEDLVLPQIYRMREVSDRIILNSGGALTKGSVIVEDLTPPYTVAGGGGYTPLQLNPALGLAPEDLNVQIFYIVTGDLEGVYTLYALETGDPVLWKMVLNRTRMAVASTGAQ